MPLSSIVVASDGSADARLAEVATADLAVRTGAAVHAVHAWHVPAAAVTGYTGYVPTPELEGLLERGGTEILGDVVSRLEASGTPSVTPHLRGGPAGEQILAAAAQVNASLIVLGSRGLGPVRRLVMGSVSEHVVHHGHWPALVMRGDQPWPPTRVVVGDDGSPEAMAASRMAADIARSLTAEVTVVHVIPHLGDSVLSAPGLSVDTLLAAASREVEERAAPLEALLGRAPGVQVVIDEPAAGLISVAETGRPTLVAVGTRGAGAVNRMLIGSVSTKVLRASVAPVLVVPHAA